MSGNFRGRGGYQGFKSKPKDPKKVFFQNVGHDQVVMSFRKGEYNKQLVDALVHTFHAIRIDIPESDKKGAGIKLFKTFTNLKARFTPTDLRKDDTMT